MRWQKGIRGDGKDFLKDEYGKEAFKRVIPSSTQMLVKSIAEYGRDEYLNVKIFTKELEERWGIINKYVLTV